MKSLKTLQINNLIKKFLFIKDLNLIIKFIFKHEIKSESKAKNLLNLQFSSYLL